MPQYIDIVFSRKFSLIDLMNVVNFYSIFINKKVDYVCVCVWQIS